MNGSLEFPKRPKEGLIFGFLNESKAKIYATANDWKSPISLEETKFWENSDWSPSGENKLFSKWPNAIKKLEAKNDLDFKLALTVSLEQFGKNDLKLQ